MAAVERDWLILGPFEPWRPRDELEAENATQRAVIQHLLAGNEEAIRELVARQAGLQEALTAYDDVVSRAPADLYAMIQRMWAWESAERKRYGTERRTDRDKPGGGEAAIIAAVMKSHGGRLPARLKRGAAKKVAADLGYRAAYVSQVVTERRKRNH